MKNTFIVLIFFVSGFLFAQQTYVPDDNFEYYLETHDADGNSVSVGDANSMGNGVANDDYVLTSRISNVTMLNLYGKNIADLTGIEDFAALTYLYCPSNQLMTLDMSQNTNLTMLECWDNQLSSLNISANTNLEFLYCSSNYLTDLDISLNTNLKGLSCINNQLTDLDVSQLTSLTSLLCNDNQFLTSLDMRNGNNVNLEEFIATDNPGLTCVFVDDAGYMNTNWSGAIDDTATYVENQAECDALGIDESFRESIRIYPNPFTGDVFVQTTDPASIRNIRIRNVQGQTVYQGNYTPHIDLSRLSAGMYWMSLENTDGNRVVYKLVKE